MEALPYHHFFFGELASGSLRTFSKCSTFLRFLLNTLVVSENTSPPQNPTRGDLLNPSGGQRLVCTKSHLYRIVHFLIDEVGLEEHSFGLLSISDTQYMCT